MIVVMSVEINKQSLLPFIIYNKPFKYNKHITLYPVKMKNVIAFQQYQIALTLRKDAIFQDKKIIKMEYWEFIKYACRNQELAETYQMPLLPFYWDFAVGMIQLACDKNTKIQYNTSTLDITINDCEVTNELFNDIRRIIIIQNDIDFDIDEFMNIDTVKALEKAREFEAKKNQDNADIEDYIDSLIVGLKTTEEYVSNLTIRKFWRYIKRLNKYDEYEACRSGEMTGMVTFKEPLKHWMTSIEVEDKYGNLKTDEEELRSKIE